ncbi:cytosolic phospholipase A2 zeta-like isoform X2 [Clupea harengus]|uniref:Phospholipase A2 n=1 Tax=Clupea harengus TaxID=7950 RepID=A0A6P8GKC9_CLUHA|nr:cytosolic phospholipase A2 zeta-like isoform X2 [Clupea harengus]
MSKLKVVPYWRLSVTVLRAELHQSYDYLSESDCYMILRLPTSSARSHRTQTVSNSNNPEWNETFHFRIHSHIKNVLEMQFYDEDPFKQDDLCSVELFDISNLILGQQQTKMFIINKKTNAKLWVEFEMAESAEDPGTYLSNGVLVAAPFSTIDITANLLGTALQSLILKFKGAYKEEHVLTSGLVDSLRYYINRDLETELSVQGEDTVQPIQLSPDSLWPISTKQEVKMPVGMDVVDLELKSEGRPEQELAVRLDFDIPSAEKDFLEKRKVVVGRALHKLLELSSPLQTDMVPLVGVVSSGGGTRAMTGLFGSLKGLQTLGILDAISYITGVSGATWAMSTLYENADWSLGDLGMVTEPMKVEMIKRYQNILSEEQLSYYWEEMGQKGRDGLPVSPIDMWGLAIEHLIYGKKWDSTLSDQKRAVSGGQNPLPIYTAVNTKTSLTGIKEAEWCEFTPYEVGLPKYGAFVPTEDFGSEYFLGHQVKKLPQTRLPFMIGIWSSFLSVNLTDLWHLVTGFAPSWIGSDVVNTETDNNPSTLDTFLIKPATNIMQMITNFFTYRPFVSQIYNFMRGLYLHWDYNSTNGFTVGQDTHPDAFPNQLTPADPTLNLVDSGLSCNTGFPPVLRPHRRMDLILSLNYSWDSDQFMVLKKTQQHCTDHRIPFPHIDFSRVEKEAMKEVYVFEDEKNPKAPIVVHFPLANLTFREFKAPGVRREGKDELRMGELDVSSSASPYITTNLAYQPEDFQKLMDLTCYNILNNRDTLLSALRRALQRERVHEDEHKPSCP